MDTNIEFGWSKMKENKLVDLSMDFAVEVLEMTDGIKLYQLKHFEKRKKIQ